MYHWIISVLGSKLIQTECEYPLVKLRLFVFSRIGRAKDWLQCIPNCVVHSWKELEDKFFKGFFTNVQFIERIAEISNFDQGDSESLSDA